MRAISTEGVLQMKEKKGQKCVGLKVSSGFYSKAFAVFRCSRGLIHANMLQK